MIVFNSLTEAFWFGFSFGALGIAILVAIASTIIAAVYDSRNKPCEKCGKPHKDCICEKVPTKRGLMKEIKKFQKEQEIEKLKERLEILKKGDK
jgi:hypothetical protein